MAARVMLRCVLSRLARNVEDGSEVDVTLTIRRTPNLSFLVAFLLLASSASAWAQMGDQNGARSFMDQTTIRIWGAGNGRRGVSPLLGVLAKLEADYRTDHPDTDFANSLNGNDSALGALYVGAADVALMDRDPSYIELDGYQQVIAGQKPFIEAIMRGGIAVAGHSSPLVIIVNRDNPLDTLSVTQLERIFDTTSEGAGQRAKLWGDLGLRGIWTSRPLHLYGFGIETDEARTFSKAVLNDSRRWPCGYRGMGGVTGAAAARRIRSAVASDRNAIGVTTFDSVSADTKIVAIEGLGDKAILATPDTLRDGRYILGRTVLALAKAQKDGSMEAGVRSFLAYLVSARAESIVVADGEYLPLADDLLDTERKVLR